MTGLQQFSYTNMTGLEHQNKTNMRGRGYLASLFYFNKASKQLWVWLGQEGDYIIFLILSSYLHVESIDITNIVFVHVNYQ